MLLLKSREETGMTTKRCRSWISLGIFGTLSWLGGFAHAADMSWSGLYRVEGLKIENPGLDASKQNKAYMLHHLILQPKMVAADGVTIFGRFDLMNAAAYPDSQLGQVFGNGPGAGAGATNSRNSNVLSQNGQDETLNVTQLYAQWVHEFGSLVIGRAPLQFGLGMTHSAGNGMFDHWFDTRDMVGYKVITGNLFIMPILGKVNEGALGFEDDVNDYILQMQYENPETDLALGVMVEWRVATNSGTDTPTGATGIGGAGSTVTNSYKHQLSNVFVTQRAGDFKIGVEGGFQNGKTGVRGAGPEVDINGFGVAAEIGYKKPDSKWDWMLKAGVASGDDPGTANKYEGYVFDRNYDVAILMLNHPLGRYDALRTSLNRDTTVDASTTVDEEAVSNVFYVSPRFQHQWKERTSWGGALTYAALDTASIAGANVDSNLGFEVDLNVTYKPYERLTWITEAALLFPGDAWKGGTSNLENKFAYGVSTKAAISF